jgi:hypothetical protein
MPPPQQSDRAGNIANPAPQDQTTVPGGRTAPKKRARGPKRLVIGEGNDVIEEWQWPFEGPIETIGKYAKELSKLKVDIDWRRILQGIEGVDLGHVDKLYIETTREIPELLAFFSETWRDQEYWGGECPGRDGHWIEICVYARDKKKVLNRLNLIADRLRALYPPPGES